MSSGYMSATVAAKSSSRSMMLVFVTYQPWIREEKQIMPRDVMQKIMTASGRLWMFQRMMSWLKMKTRGSRAVRMS